MFAIVESDKRKTKMINKLIYSITRHRHPWRELQFDELAELYTSMSLRSFGFGLIGIFVPVFLYTEGVSLRGIFLFFVVFFLFRIPVAFISGKLVGRIGPKHAIAISTIIIITFLAMLLSYSVLEWPLALMAIVLTCANGLFFVAYNTDFSKIQHKKHGGKELGWMIIFERAGAALGPFIGGLLAAYFAPELTIALAITVLILSLVPLFMSSEPVKTHQKINYKNFSPLKYSRNFFALSSFQIVNWTDRVLWPLFIGIIIFDDNPYAELGLLIGVSTAISLIAARMFGKFIDSKKGNALLKYGAVMGTILGVSRSLITTAGGATAVTVLGEPTALANRMPMTQGNYDQADSIEGYRIVYLVWAEALVSIGKMILCFILLVLTFHISDKNVFLVGFLIAAIASPFMLFQKFPALKKV